MLPKNNRLSNSTEIEDIKSNSKRVHTPLFTALYNNPKTDSSRFAFIVSSKVSKKAVVRNKIKRLAREAVKVNLDKLPRKDYVLIFKKEAITSSLAKFVKSFENLSQKI